MSLAHTGLPDTQDEQGPYVVLADVVPLTWQQVAKSQQLSPSWDYQQAVDQRFVP